MAPAPLQTVCLRHLPPALAGDEEALTAHNAAIVERVTAGGGYYFGTSQLKGRLIIRVSVGAQPTSASTWPAHGRRCRRPPAPDRQGRRTRKDVRVEAAPA